MNDKYTGCRTRTRLVAAIARNVVGVCAALSSMPSRRMLLPQMPRRGELVLVPVPPLRSRLVLNAMAREIWIHSPPTAYVVNLDGIVRPHGAPSRSDTVVNSLMAHDPRIRRSRGFHRAVFEAIFNDAFYADFGELPSESPLYARVRRRWGARRAPQVVARCVETLREWQRCAFIPDAFLIDSSNRTVVCYEVEDTNPLKAKPLLQYSFAWWALSEIWWDLHLITYDIFGNARVITVPEAAFLSGAYGPQARPRGRRHD